MTVVSISLTPELLQRLDDFILNSGYSSRSEAIRLAIRETLSRFTLQRLVRGSVVATVTVIYDRERHELTSHLMKLRHEFDEKIFGNMHLHVGSGFCLEIFLVQGEADKVIDFISKVRAVRGILEVNYTMTPIEERFR